MISDKHQVKAELEKIEVALREPQTEERYMQMYAAQQALAWTLSPSSFASPYKTVQRGLIRPLTDTLEGSVGYSAQSCPPLSLETCGQIGS
jgi:hypothetical protein